MIIKIIQFRWIRSAFSRFQILNLEKKSNKSNNYGSIFFISYLIWQLELISFLVRPTTGSKHFDIEVN